MLYRKKCKGCGKNFTTANKLQATCGEVECWAANNEARKKRYILNARRYKKFNDSIKKEKSK